MANYSLVTDNRYDPFSYEEIERPLLEATAAHRDLEEKYGVLNEKAEEVSGLINETDDPGAFKLYKDYLDNLNASMEALNAYGLTPRSGAALMGLRGQYARDIGNIRNAYANRAQLIENYRTENEKNNGTLLVENNPREMSLDMFLNNPSQGIGWQYSGDKIMEDTAFMAQQYAKELTNMSNPRPNTLAYQYIQKFRYGASPDEFLKWLQGESNNGNSEAMKMMNSIRNSVINATGVDNIQDDKKRDTMKGKINSYINMGMAAIMGKTDVNNLVDTYNMQKQLNEDAYDYSHQKDSEEMLMQKLNSLQFADFGEKNENLEKPFNQEKQNSRTNKEVYDKWKNSVSPSTGNLSEEMLKYLRSQKGDAFRKGLKLKESFNDNDAKKAWWKFVNDNGLGSDIIVNSVLRVDVPKEADITKLLSNAANGEWENNTVKVLTRENEGFKPNNKEINFDQLNGTDGDNYTLRNIYVDINEENNKDGTIVFELAKTDKKGKSETVYVKGLTGLNNNVDNNISSLINRIATNRKAYKRNIEKENYFSAAKLEENTGQLILGIQDNIQSLFRSAKVPSEEFDTYTYIYQ